MAHLLFSRIRWIALFVMLYWSVNQQSSEAQVLEEEFSGKVVSDMRVNLPTEEVWAVYRSRDFGHRLLELSSEYFKQIDYVTGNGDVGTVLNITLQPAFGSANWLDKVIKIDDKSKTLTLQRIQGGLLNSGFTVFETEYQIKKNDDHSCVLRETMSFKVKPQSISNASSLQPNWRTAIAAANYVNSMKSTPLVLEKDFSGKLVSYMKVNLPDDDVWNVYRSKNFSDILLLLMPFYFKSIELVSGDGGAGSIVNVTLQPGTSSWLDQIAEINDKTMTRQLHRVSGGHLDNGYTLFDVGYVVVKKRHNSCVIEAITSFKIRADSLSNVFVLAPSWFFSQTIANYVNSLKA